MQSQACTANSDCVSQECAYEFFDPKASLVCCWSGESTRIWTSATDGWPNTGHKDFCQYQPIGTICGVTDNICASRACVRGKCVASKIKNKQLCDINNDCISRKCAHDFYSPNATLSCCSSGESESVYTYAKDGWPSDGSRSFCTHQPEGTVCGVTDAICSSKACVGEKCSPSKIANGQQCNIDNDCVSDKCSYGFYSSVASLVCCPSGESKSVLTYAFYGWPSDDTRKFCTKQPDGTQCGTTDEICASNACVKGKCTSTKISHYQPCRVNNDCMSGSCAYEFFSSDAPLKCCSSGVSKYILSHVQDGWPETKYRYFCTHQPDETLCGNNDDICASSACVGGKCVTSKIVNGQQCDDNNDCVSGKCAREFFSPEASLVCCWSGESTNAHTVASNGWPTDDYRSFCSHQPNDSMCGVTDEICASGACVGGICASQKYPNDYACAIDNDCMSGQCAYDFFGPESSLVCCSSGETRRVYTLASDGWPSSEYRYFCSFQPDGTLCGEIDEICESNTCAGGICESPATPTQSVSYFSFLRHVTSLCTQYHPNNIFIPHHTANCY